MSDRLLGTGLLVRFALRRDRVLASAWVAILTVMVVASAAGTSGLYADTRERVAAAEAINASPAIIALYGPILDVQSAGELAMTKMTVLYAVFVAFMAVVVVRRHTRVEEETGRAELVGATALGADAPVAAALIEATLLSIAVGVLASLGNIASGLPVGGSMLFGASWTGIGLVGAGIALLAAQVSSSARAVGFLASTVIGALYLVRAVGDTSAHWLSWLSPFGWGTQLSAWSSPRGWVLALHPLLAMGLAAVALALRRRRDLGAGLLPDRPGPASGSPRLRDAVALAWRTQQTALIGWTLAIAVMGVLMGSIIPDIGSLLDSDNARATIEAMGGIGGLQDALLFAMASVIAVVITCFGIAAITRAAGDEHDGRTETVLATATSRDRLLLAIGGLALLGTTWLLLVSGVATAVGRGDGVDGIWASLVQAPAVWLVLGLGLVLLTLRSRWAIAGWALVVTFVTVGQLGESLRLPDWMIGLSPYHHVPKYPAEAFSWRPELVMTAMAAVALGVAWLRFRSRDIG
ncbi:ABC transporter permease [Nocardioides sp.]|uniref:ABC transporter permease n=1 Tax=Nocardioides sp. TaxID=35761 RepID=UPI00286DDF16|nr:ABC transporter permease [Nocardioides sp.]